MIDAVTCGKWEPDSFDLTKSQKFVVRMALSILIFWGVKFIMRFEVGIEGKDPMDKDEDDWGGRLEFGFSE